MKQHKAVVTLVEGAIMVAVAVALVVTPGMPSKVHPSIIRKTGTVCAGFSFFW